MTGTTYLVLLAMMLLSAALGFGLPYFCWERNPRQENGRRKDD